jgi:hypothetical protein
MIRSAHCTDAAINLSVSGLPPGVPNKSLAVRMYRREDRGHDPEHALAAFVHPGMYAFHLPFASHEKLRKLRRRGPG